MIFPKLKAVVEIENYSGTEFDAWEIMQTKGIYLIELSAETSFVETGTFVYRLAEYGRENDFESGLKPQKVFREILSKEILIVQGGLQAVNKNAEVISPGCCFGLESWREWFDVNPQSIGIWLGHDPNPSIEYFAETNSMRLWSDEQKSFHIDFEYRHLQQCLIEVERDLQNFVGVLKDWAKKINKNLANDLVNKVKVDFDI